MNALDFLTQTIKTGASALFIVAGRQLSFKKGGRIETLGEERLMPADTEKPNAAFSKSINFSYNRIQKNFFSASYTFPLTLNFYLLK